METLPSCPTPAEPARFSISRVKPLPILLAAAFFFVVTASIEFGLRIHWQRTAVRQIEEFGGNVHTETWQPLWLRDWLDSDVFQWADHVDGVSLSNTDVTDDALRCIARLPEIESLDLLGTNVSDDGVAILRALPRLRWLSISGMTGRGLMHLTAVTELDVLGIDAVQLTDEGLAAIGELANLKALYLCASLVRDSGLTHLKKLKRLTRLELQHTEITDIGMSTLAEISTLEHLSLEDTSITDVGLAHLKRLSHLRLVVISGTTVTAAGVEDLQSALPDLYVQNESPMKP